MIQLQENHSDSPHMGCFQLTIPKALLKHSNVFFLQSQPQVAATQALHITYHWTSSTGNNRTIFSLLSS